MMRPLFLPISHRFLLFFACAVLVSAAGRPAHAAAAQNPLNTIEAQTADAKSPGIKIEPAHEGGVTLMDIHDGDFAVFKDYDFDSGVAAFKARVASPHKGSIEVRLDGATGKLIGTCAVETTGGWETWQDVQCNVDNTEAGARDVYLIFHGDGKGGAVLNFQSFVFLKTSVLPSTGKPDLSTRLDKPDDGEPQGVHAWGMPEKGFADNFADGKMTHWTGSGFTVADKMIKGGSGRALAFAGHGQSAFAYTPDVYINKTDTGGAWRTIAEGAISVDIVPGTNLSRPGVGFASKDGKQAIYVTLDSEHNSLDAWRKLADGTTTLIRHHPKLPTDPLPDTDKPDTWTIKPSAKYRLQVDWSPYSDALIAFLYDAEGKELTNFRTVIDLPAARRPLLVCSGGPASFGNVKFDPTLDDWNYHWEWKKEPVLQSDVCNPAVWKGKDSKMYMMWRKFGADTFHGIASSTDGIKWTRVTDQAIKCTGDMNVVVDPFGDGKWYVTPGSGGMPWWTSDGADNFKTWTQTPLKLGNIFGNSRVQEIIDTRRVGLKPVSFEGKDYRFIAYTEDWVHLPKPHTVVLLSNTLTDWVVGGPEPLIPPRGDFWGEKGSAIGSAFALPDGRILISSCSCTNEGYTGAPEPSNISALADGKEPWKLLKLAVLPDAPMSRENVWYQGPNFGTAFYYDKDSDTLFFYGGFHDYYIGMMRVRHFLHPEAR